MKVLIGTGVLVIGILGAVFALQETRPYSPTNFGSFLDQFNQVISELPANEEQTLTSGRVTVGDRQRILGSWQVVSAPLHWSGKNKDQGNWYVFDKNQFSIRNMRGGKIPSKGEWKLDDEVSPRRISLTVDGAETQALYRIQGEFLSIFYRQGADDFPSSFPTPVSFGESGTLLVLQRTEYSEVEFPHSDPTPEEARLLTSYQNSLTLPTLSKLNPETTAMLANHEGFLSLPAVVEMTPETARLLATKTGGTLSLWGLKAMTPEVAKELGNSQCGLALGLESITPEVATALGSKAQSLTLNHLRTITPDAAKPLAAKGGRLVLNGLTLLDVEVAEALAAHTGWLTLNGIETLTRDAAEALSSFRGKKLDLDGLPILNIEIAEALVNARPSNSLSFNGVKTLSPEVAASLVAGNHRHLSLQGLETLPEESLSILRRHQLRKVEGNTGGMLLPYKFDLPDGR